MRVLIMNSLFYGALLVWAFVCFFPIYWTVTTSFKTAPDLAQGHLLPYFDYWPKSIGWRAIGLSPDLWSRASMMRNQLASHVWHSLVVASAASVLSVVLGAPASYGLSRFRYSIGPFGNRDISFFFLSQLVVPPVALAMPFLILYKELQFLDTLIGLIIVYTLMVLPIVIWIMRDQFSSLPFEVEEAAQVDGLSTWGVFTRVAIPLSIPGIAAALILSFIFCWNEYFFAALLSGSGSETLPVLVATQTSTNGVPWWAMAALSTVAIGPLIVVGLFLQKYIVKGLTAGAVK
jgi:multiple sugar transport system permease protein